MPVKSCQKDGKPGWKWGDSGYCYTYTKGNKESSKRARQKAIKQGRAIQVNKSNVLEILKGIKESLKNILEKC